MAEPKFRFRRVGLKDMVENKIIQKKICMTSIINKQLYNKETKIINL